MNFSRSSDEGQNCALAVAHGSDGLRQSRLGLGELISIILADNNVTVSLRRTTITIASKSFDAPDRSWPERTKIIKVLEIIDIPNCPCLDQRILFFVKIQSLVSKRRSNKREKAYKSGPGNENFDKLRYYSNFNTYLISTPQNHP
jgi:hypothetical protein